MAMTVTMKTLLYITKTCNNMNVPQNTINPQTLKKTSQNNPKVICSSSLAVMWGLLLFRQLFGNKTQKTNIKEKVINPRSKGNATPFSH